MDEDEKEEEERTGLVRNVFRDDAWDAAFEEEINHLSSMYKAFPSPFTVGMRVRYLTSILLFLVLSAAMMAAFLIGLPEHNQRNYTILVSSLRPTVLTVIRYFFMRLVHIGAASITCPQNITFEGSTNPMWKNMSHMSNNRELLQKLTQEASVYYQTMLMAAHFGDSADSKSNDETLNRISTQRLPSEINADMLLSPHYCLLEDKSKCTSSTISERISGIYYEFFGITALSARMRLYIKYLQTEEMTSYPLPIDNESPYFRFINTALANDLLQGTQVITDDLVQQSADWVSLANDILTIVTSVCCVIAFGSLLFLVLPLRRSVMKVHRNTDRLKLLLPVDEDEKEMDLLPSMMTGLIRWDANHQKIMDAAQSVVDAVKDGESTSSVTQSHLSLLQLCQKVFAEEEAEMEESQLLTAEELNAHKLEHLLIRQRLSVLYDQLHSHNEAVRVASKRALVRLFDKHFTQDDQLFAHVQHVLEGSLDNNETSYLQGDEANLKTNIEF